MANGGSPIALRFALLVTVAVPPPQQRYALHHLLPEDGEAENRHAVVHHSHEKRADDDTHHLTDAARGRDAADEARSDHVEFEVIARAWRRRIEARGDNQARKSGKDTHVDERKQGQSLGADA